MPVSSTCTADRLVPRPTTSLGVDFWTRTTPAWPLLDAMRAGTAWGRLVALVDNAEEAIAHLRAHLPLPAATEPWSFCVAHCDAAPLGTTPVGPRP